MSYLQDLLPNHGRKLEQALGTPGTWAWADNRRLTSGLGFGVALLEAVKASARDIADGAASSELRIRLDCPDCYAQGEVRPPERLSLSKLSRFFDPPECRTCHGDGYLLRLPPVRVSRMDLIDLRAALEGKGKDR